MTADSSGAATSTSLVRSDGTSSSKARATVLSITAGGIISFSDDTSFRGAMSSDKAMVTAIMSDGGRGYNLMILQK